MTDNFFCKYIFDCILRLYPNINLEQDFDDKGGIISCPVLIKTDTGPGRLCSNFAIMDFRQKLKRMGCHIILSLPNTISVSAKMNNLYREYKECCWQKTQTVFHKKFYARMMKIRENTYIADPKKRHTIKLVNLNSSDLSLMINGKEGDSIELTFYLKMFNLNIIKKSQENVGFALFTRKCQENKKVRHEVDETVPNRHSYNVEELQQKINTVKERLTGKGFNSEHFDKIVPKAFKIKRLKKKIELRN